MDRSRVAELRALLERLRLPLLLLALTHLLGTVGFWLLWRPRGSWLDALFMTFITVTTIGFEEVHPLGDAGRVLAMAVAAGGMGTLFYSLTVVLDFATSEQGRAARRIRKMQSAIDALSRHYVIAGIGRVGREAADELAGAGRPFVVIDPSDTTEAYCAERGFLYLRADATEDAVLERAGIKRARGLIVTTSSDATNLYVILSARLLNPEFFIAARAADEASVPKLLRAGANRAISPYAIGGRRLAHLMVSPRAVDFFETALKRGNKSLNIDDILVAPSSSAAAKTLGELQLQTQSGATVLAVLRDGVPMPNPRGDFALGGGDHLLVLGTDEQLQKLEAMLGS